ncbi:S-adenosylmethionine decarboxylase family protein [Nocardia anaemiae]|uniref:S-adenosylmethionine decarboxylase family protein n=1 Tax=Nocardia anaemiae TaxID=263910 RepID=UPI0007A377C6|nr:S-adenosylmethionine decarboxylase [Nocardia anaemiae]
MTSIDTQARSYGQHLMLRLCDIERVDALDDATLLSDFLVALVHAIDMRILEGPHAAAESGDDDHYGYSAVVILYESHAAVHTYPNRRELFLDIFSCRAFEAQQVYNTCTRFFGGFTVSEYAVLDRGLHWTAPAAERLSDWMESR